MKKLLFFLITIAVLSAIGCGEPDEMGDDDTSTTSPPPTSEPPTPDPGPTYPLVKGDYSCTVVETVNTCNHNGPRGQLPSTLTMHVDQDTVEGWQAKEVFISMPQGLYYTESTNTNTSDFHLGASIGTDGSFIRINVPMIIRTLSYSAIFEGVDGIANHHRTTDQYFLEIDYMGSTTEGDVCQNGEDGQAILTLDCPKM